MLTQGSAVPGFEISGVVERVGSAVPADFAIAVGDEVVGKGRDPWKGNEFGSLSTSALCPMDGDGGLCEYVVQPYYNLGTRFFHGVCFCNPHTPTSEEAGCRHPRGGCWMPRPCVARAHGLAIPHGPHCGTDPPCDRRRIGEEITDFFVYELTRDQEYGHMAVQMALLWGAHVIATAKTEDELSYLRVLSADLRRKMREKDFLHLTLMQRDSFL